MCLLVAYSYIAAYYKQYIAISVISSGHIVFDLAYIHPTINNHIPHSIPP